MAESMAGDRTDGQGFHLTAAEARVLGALMEKETTTPEYYPLTLNALVNACNQRSNREPVMALDEDDVRQALHGLEDDGMAGRARSADGRVTKYEHWMGEAFNVSRAELQRLAEREPALVAMLPRQPGTKESRYAQLLGGPLESLLDMKSGSIAERAAETALGTAEREERIAQLEAAVAELRQEVAELREKIERLAS
jgi:uncharacterized protein YceH (UPF0502 family)